MRSRETQPTCCAVARTKTRVFRRNRASFLHRGRPAGRNQPGFPVALVFPFLSGGEKRGRMHRTP
jgi:hypothetical protein